ncbi:hypothetical protein [Asticcacaulis taihuensis]|uniref:hypothetical protein n=1 Tax=Asticcacaulis taihuensis TaxID=260084 RepID=UPI003F7C9453
MQADVKGAGVIRSIFISVELFKRICSFCWYVRVGYQHIPRQYQAPELCIRAAVQVGMNLLQALTEGAEDRIVWRHIGQAQGFKRFGSCFYPRHLEVHASEVHSDMYGATLFFSVVA